MDPWAEAADVPKADMHVHQERSPRLDRILAAAEGRPPLDWSRWMRRMAAETPPGVARLRRMQQHFPAPLEADDDPATFVARIEDMLIEAAAAGALLIEPRFGNETVLRPGFLTLLDEARARVARAHPQLCVAPVVAFQLGASEPVRRRVLERTLLGAREGMIAGVDLLCEPYDGEADWTHAHAIARVATEAGLGVTAHAGEFSTANVAAALATPGLSRIGHATQVERDPRLLDLLGESGVTVEVCLTSNVALGAVGALDEHPLPRLLAAGIPVVLGTDDPVELVTTIDREYERAAALGLDRADLAAITRTAFETSFAAPEQRARLLDALVV